MESQASSEIENIVTTHDELFRAAHNALSTVTPQVKEALRYRQALKAGFDALTSKPITVQTAIEICSTIQGVDARVRDLPGTYIGNPSTGVRVYTPPEGKDVLLKHLALWEQFLHTDDGLDPLVRMALAHYQFEAIHPFFDGNGRTGRILNLLLLVEDGLMRLPVLYLSGYILRHRSEYYARLNAVTYKDEWEPWILFMLAGVQSTAEWTLSLIDAVEQIRNAFEQRIRESFPKLPATDLTRVLFTLPYARIENVVEAGLAQRQTAGRWLSDLASQGIIAKERVGRNTIYINQTLLDVIFGADLHL